MRKPFTLANIFKKKSAVLKLQQMNAYNKFFMLRVCLALFGGRDCRKN
jgi:hypothetical protein